MATDKSPVDVTATGAVPPADDAPRGDSPAEPAASPAASRATSTRKPRSQKIASEKPSKKIDAFSPPEPAKVPDPLEISARALPVESKSRAARRPSAPRTKKTTVPVPSASLSEPEFVEPAVAISPALPIVEALASNKPRPSRRRSSDKKEAAPKLTQAISPEPIVVQPAEAVLEAVVAETAVEKPRRGARGGRGRTRSKARPAPETLAVGEISTEPEATAAFLPAEIDPATGAVPEKKPASRRRSSADRPPAPAEDLRIGARLVTRKGFAEIHINGEPYPPVFFFGNVEDTRETRKVQSEVRRAAANGVHLHSTLIEIPCPLPPDDSVYELLDSRLQVFLEADPHGYVMPRLVFVPAPGWMRQYPNEVTHYADGKSADPSIASDRFWTDAEHALGAVVEHLRRVTYADRVIGYHLERGEWFNPADNGYDRSFANREAFREWLRTKYKNSAVALRAAWFDGDVQFHTAEIPPSPEDVRSEIAFFEPRRQRRWIDFLEYTSDITASRLIALSKVVKTASANRALVSVCYGYTFEFEHTFSGHLALGKVLAAPSIDLIAGPPSYKDRQPGAAGSLPGPVDSMLVHGKLWISEDDTKTHLASTDQSSDDYNPRCDSRTATESVHDRAIGSAFAHQSGIAWMDLWGEGWLDSEDVWSKIGTSSRRYREFMKHRHAESPEVAVLVDERSLFHLQRGPAAMKRLLQDQREAIQRCGSSIGFYLQSDVTARNFPTGAKLYIFLNPYRLPVDQRNAIKEKLHTGGKTLVWMYAVGVCDERGEPEEGAHDVIGIALRQQSWNSEAGSRITDTRHAITNHISPREFGVREKLNPTFYVDDEEPGLMVLAEYQQSGLPSLALRKNEGWTSVFCGEPTLTNELLRGLCRFAKVHLYTAMPDDYFAGGFGWLTSHSSRDGHRTIHLPAGSALYDLSENRLIGENLTEHKGFVKAHTTRSFFLGSVDEMRKLGLPGTEKARSRRGRAPKEPAAAHPAEPEATSLVAESPLNGEAALDGAEAAPIVAGDAAAEQNGAQAHRRRRRRRGGRGRGRRQPADSASPASGSDGQPAGE